MDAPNKAAQLFARWTEGVASEQEAKELFTLLRGDEVLLKMLVETEFTQFTGERPVDANLRTAILQWASNESYTIEEVTPMMPVRRSSFLHRAKMIAAAVIILAAVSTWLLVPKNETGQEPEQTAQATDVSAPNLSKATITLADGRKVSLDSLSQGLLALDNGVQVRKNKNGEIIYEAVTNHQPSEMVYNTLVNPRGSKVVHVTLSEGTMVWLNTESSLRYPVAFMGDEREVEITGEAYFEVAHDSKKPFHVTVSGMDVEVLGTNFNINSYRDEESMKTTLLEGSIKISAGGKSRLVRPGQQTQVTTNNEIKLINDADIRVVTAWKSGFFAFEAADIKEIMKQLSRWYDVEVIYQGEPKELFTGRIDRNLTLSQVLKALARNGVNFRIEDGKRLIILP